MGLISAFIASIPCFAIAQPQVMDDSASGIPAAIVKEALRITSSKRRDPYSTQFEDLRLSADGKKVCGLMNAKNIYGAYSGFGYFLVDLERRTAEIEEDDYCPDRNPTTPAETEGCIAYLERYIAFMKRVQEACPGI